MSSCSELPSISRGLSSPSSFSMVGEDPVNAMNTTSERVLEWNAGVPATVVSQVTTAAENQDPAPATTDTPKFIPYLYYWIYTPDGAVPSKKPVCTDDPYLGRVDARRVAPPQTVNSIIRCICKIENISNYSRTNLFAEVSSLSAMDKGEHVKSMSGNDSPGSTAEYPLALVQEDEPAEAERVVLLPQEPDLFVKKIRVKGASSSNTYSTVNPAWLDHPNDEECLTDGVVCSMVYTPGTSHSYSGYQVRNAAGKKGFVESTYIVFIS